MIPPNDRVTSAASMKARQSCKIGELRDTLFAAGFHTIQEQSDALGICRSTAWTIFRTLHKNSGLSAAIINQMLASPQLPSAARTKILEYVDEKVAGRYGHSAAPQVYRQNFSGAAAPRRNSSALRSRNATPEGAQERRYESAASASHSSHHHL